MGQARRSTALAHSDAGPCTPLAVEAPFNQHASCPPTPLPDNPLLRRWPGVQAAHMISIARKEYTPDWRYAEAPGGEGATQPTRLLYSYFTAGSGGVGPTILETSLLLAGEPVVAYK